MYCRPADGTTSKFEGLWQESSNTDYAFVEDIMTAWKACAICILLGIIYTVMFMYALAYCTTTLAFISIAYIELFFLGGMAVSAYYAITTVNGDSIWPLTLGFAVAWLIFNLCLFCCWKKVKIAIAILDASADFLVETIRLSAVTFSYALLFCLYLVFFVVALMAVMSMNKVTVER